MIRTYDFHHGWKFRLANRFPMAEALTACRDSQGLEVYDPACCDADWEAVTLPHTFNDVELFSVPIEDAGSGQTRTAAFYRNVLAVPAQHRQDRAYISFEGMRQTCYLYVNGQLAGYYEAGVGPFGFDITPFLSADGSNQITVLTDNTSTRNIPFCIAETPNKPDVTPGSYLFPQEQPVPANQEGVGFFWNCNDFNPVLGGISQPVRVHFKPDVHLTLPLYANLQTHGTYVYGSDFDIAAGSMTLHVDAEVRNLKTTPVDAQVRVVLRTLEGDTVAAFTTDAEAIQPAPAQARVHRLSITPEDAYVWDEATQHYIPVPEEDAAPTVLRAVGTQVIRASARVSGVRFWRLHDPALYRVEVTLLVNGCEADQEVIETGFRKVGYDKDQGVTINDQPVWLRGYAQRATNEWAAAGIVPEWMHDLDALLIRESGANHIRFMHVAGSPADVRAYDRHGIVCTQPAGDKEKENFGRQWDQRVELMRNVILAYRNHPSIFFWEAGNNSISAAHMAEMKQVKDALDPHGGRFMGCRTINTEDVLVHSEYVGTMLNRHAGRFLSEHGPITETEYSREEAPRRIWDDFTPPDFDYRCKWLGKAGKKEKGRDFYDLTSEELALANARGYAEFFNDRLCGASGKKYYSAAAALCWTDSAQHGRQSWSENGRMSGRVDAIRVKKQSFDVYRTMQTVHPAVKIVGHWNYPAFTADSYCYHEKVFNGSYWEETDTLLRRDPLHKTVYVIASYPVAKVELYVNGSLAGSCDQPENTFVFPIPDVNVTASGYVKAIGYGYDGQALCRDRIETAGDPAEIRLTLRTSPEGLHADGADIACVDVEVVDAQGRICPLCDKKITFRVTGDAVFLGGYNSGRFDGNGRSDNVIHQDHVYAECGTNRVLLRAGKTPGEITLTASAEGLPGATLTCHSIPADTSALRPSAPVAMYDNPPALFDPAEDFIPAIPEADAAKYTPDAECYCKIMVNGQEPDFRGVRAVNRNGAIWGNVLCIMERMKATDPARMDFTWDAAHQRLTLLSGGHTIIAQAGVTHLLVDGQESLMDGQPYVNENGILVMEVNAIAPHVMGASAQYDDKIGALRITM
ncbi:MAG: sugar-binding domain-containing protein [Aristaeellaceae bacterium]